MANDPNTDGRNLKRQIEKCEMEWGSENEDGDTEWAVEVPDDAHVRVEMAVYAGKEREIVGASNVTGRYELTLIEEAEADE